MEVVNKRTGGSEGEKEKADVKGRDPGKTQENGWGKKYREPKTLGVRIDVERTK